MLRSTIRSSKSKTISLPTLSSLTPSRQKHTLPDLPYAYSSLEPTISTQIMKLHHQKHHQTYITNLNLAEAALSNALATNDLAGIIAGQGALKFAGGGHLNHSLFWENLAPRTEGGGTLKGGALSDALSKQFGNLDGFKEAFNASLASIQGSGWSWLTVMEGGRLNILTTANQDPVNVGTQGVVVLGVDAWEHAYYLQYENNKVAYFKGIWDVINWEVAGRRYSEGLSKHKK